MARRKTLFDDLLDLFERLSYLYVLYLFLLWFIDRSSFWRWVIYGIIFFVVLFAVIYWRKRVRMGMGAQWLSDRELIQMLRGKTPTEFEDYVADLFSRLGYKIEVTGGSHDRGVDVIAEKNGIKHYIQCKKFYRWEVRVGDVRDFYGSIADHLANGKGYFITTNKFTLEAEQFAEDKPIELVDSFKIIKYIRMVEGNQKESAIENKSKICPKCGANLVERVGKYGKFYGCSNYPKCQYTENIKK